MSFLREFLRRSCQILKQWNLKWSQELCRKIVTTYFSNKSFTKFKYLKF